MNFEPDDATLKDEQELVYGLLEKVEGIANGTKNSTGKVPTTLILQTRDNGGAMLTVSIDTIKEMCGGDMERTLDACRNLSIAVNAAAQLLIFERELKGQLAPSPGSGLHAETVFAVGRSINSPRERAFVVVRGRDKLYFDVCPNWEKHDDGNNKQFAYVLPDATPTAKEQEIACNSLREIGIAINRREFQEREQIKDERRKRGRGFGRSF